MVCIDPLKCRYRNPTNIAKSWFSRPTSLSSPGHSTDSFFFVWTKVFAVTLQMIFLYCPHYIEMLQFRNPIFRTDKNTVVFPWNSQSPHLWLSSMFSMTLSRPKAGFQRVHTRPEFNMPTHLPDSGKVKTAANLAIRWSLDFFWVSCELSHQKKQTPLRFFDGKVPKFWSNQRPRSQNFWNWQVGSFRSERFWGRILWVRRVRTRNSHLPPAAPRGSF